MKIEHTPGPWMFGIRGDKKPIEKPFNYHGPGYYDNPSIFGADGTEIAGCDEYMIFNKEEDIRLIAAAPDLLEACQTFSEWLRREDKGFAEEGRNRKTPEGEAAWREWYYENLRICRLAQDQVKAAISKATGQA
jgi:hypothetical protein